MNNYHWLRFQQILHASNLLDRQPASLSRCGLRALEISTKKPGVKKLTYVADVNVLLIENTT